MDINPTALLIIAFFTAVAALSGDWLVGLAVGLGTIIVCTIANRRDDTPIILFGFVVLLVLLLVTPASAAGPLDRKCPPSPRGTYVLTACQARDLVALVADETHGRYFGSSPRQGCCEEDGCESLAVFVVERSSGRWLFLCDACAHGEKS